MTSLRTNSHSSDTSDRGGNASVDINTVLINKCSGKATHAIDRCISGPKCCQRSENSSSSECLQHRSDRDVELCNRVGNKPVLWNEKRDFCLISGFTLLLNICASIGVCLLILRYSNFPAQSASSELQFKEASALVNTRCSVFNLFFYL